MIPVVVGSNPIGHPSFSPQKWRTPPLGGRAEAAAAFVALFSAALAQVESNARGVTQSADPEFLHQLRVGLRRLRTVQRAFRDIIPQKSVKPLRRTLRKIKPALGMARDWDVFVQGIPRELRAAARRRGATARRSARAAVNSPEFRQFLLHARYCAHETPCKRFSLRDIGAEALDAFRRKTIKSARRIDWQDEKRRHALRIRVRRLRYACEFFAPVFPRAKCVPYLKRVEALQDLLGELNDVAVARRLLQALGPPAAAALVRRELAVRERGLIASIEPAWAGFEKRRAFWR